MKSYYHAHELAYQQIKENGFIGWGNAKTLTELGDENTDNYLKKTMTLLFPNPQGKKALDVGCGTGTTAFTLAKLGFDVTGVDVSETAIEMGRDLALQQDLKIQFLVNDILKIENSIDKFDLIYDSHCLHCIVFEEDRRLALSNLKKSLTHDGIFILDTMVMPKEKINPAEDFETLRFDENFILWHKTEPSNDYGIIELNGQHWCAQRRVYPPEKMIDEIKHAGFKIVSEQLESELGKTSMLKLVLK